MDVDSSSDRIDHLERYVTELEDLIAARGDLSTIYHDTITSLRQHLEESDLKRMKDAETIERMRAEVVLLQYIFPAFSESTQLDDVQSTETSELITTLQEENAELRHIISQRFTTLSTEASSLMKERDQLKDSCALLLAQYTRLQNTRAEAIEDRDRMEAQLKESEKKRHGLKTMLSLLEKQRVQPIPSQHTRANLVALDPPFFSEGMRKFEVTTQTPQHTDRMAGDKETEKFVEQGKKEEQELTEMKDVAPDDKKVIEELESNLTPLTLAWKGLSVETPNKKKLLSNVSGEIAASLLAIMGPSGSGKTTLMNVLANRVRGVKITGEIRINGHKVSSSLLKKVSGYVMQDDLLFEHLTVEETMHYTAELRLPREMSHEEKKKRVDEALSQLGLDGCRNTVVGGATVKGISGGERKRLCVGMELITYPKLIFLDEPTSGLDSSTALSLITTLGNLVSIRNCTILCTIHQPQSKIFNLFHSVLVMSKGHIVAMGRRMDVIEQYGRAGFPCPEFTNPADHLLDVITPLNTEDKDKVQENVVAIQGELSTIQVDLEKGMVEGDYKHERSSWFNQFFILARRTTKSLLRQRLVIITQFIQSILMAILIGAVFYQIGNGQSSTIRRQPVLFFCVINQGIFAALMIINSFPSERSITLRERAAGTYYVSAYFLAKSMVELIPLILFPTIFSCIVYWMVGLQHHAGKFFLFLFFIVLTNIASTSVALAISAICRTTTLAVTVLPMALEIFRLFGGFFLAPINLPRGFVWLDALSYVKWAYTGISINELTGLVITCTDAQRVNGVCPIERGEQTIQNLGFDKFNIGECIGALFAIIIGCRIIAFLALRFIKR
ncbi:hypothetical protein PROFUN_04307 [Planoprotostelium fungivorum]|uniref:ABC transporter domain-containing protein n=1 Tax=Planoprotostelium fungivorum TaxID=1890364 RepID=A0A2P6NV33_9EUKA|nr:hypothetical protein PROFUN_04307 [Planoprotostelium fungivorum]